MSIKAMTWAFGLPLEPRAKIALLAIADNARDDGIAWPSKDTIADKSSQSRATVGRRLKSLEALGVLACVARYREDGTQTTDEIRLNLAVTPDDVMRKMHDSEQPNEAETDDEHADDVAPRVEGGGYQPDTLPVQSCDPTLAVVTGGGLHSCNPHNEPSLEPSTSPNPLPGGSGPLSKIDKEANEKREALWQRFLGSYPGIPAMDQQAAKAEFDPLAIDDAEWAVSVCPSYADECRKLRKPPKNAHIWLRKGMFRNFAKSKIAPPPPDSVWIAEGSDEDRALRFVSGLARKPARFVKTRPDGSRGYQRDHQVGADLLAMLKFASDNELKWPTFTRGSPEFAAWQTRVTAWVGQGLPCEPGSDHIRAPCRWPPKKDGTIYTDDQSSSEGNAV